jgi:hypothetical protein
VQGDGIVILEDQAVVVRESRDALEEETSRDTLGKGTFSIVR